MELRQLRYFDAIATEQNFTRAAERLGISQPPLSRQIRALEEELGVELFYRDTRPIRLTEAGRVFQQQASQILVATEQLRKSMERLGEMPEKRFVIGVVGSIMHGAMPDILRRFRAFAPDVELELVELTTLDQVAALKTGRIDAGLGRIRIADPANRRELLHKEPLVVALPASSPLGAAGEPLSLRDLAAIPLLVYPSQPRPSYADQVLSIVRDRGVTPVKIIEVREVQTALGLVAADVGYTLVPHSMRHFQSEDIVYCPLLDENAVSPIILSQRMADDSVLSLRFRQIAREVLSGEGEAD
ncbi:LysR family transcriptional regulator [Croceicoccus sediminis]|uniref:LysR family transcriptional regulator n=1 Tax=Croceicoccus sediminis TaxID=2571150 RepID=UPI001181F8A6|nr:LysR family transcriptional regulator [Croceicoccus sediminis]